MANQQDNPTWISFVFAKFQVFVFLTLLFFQFIRFFFLSDSLILRFSVRHAFSFIENYLYSIDKSHGTWKIGHDNVLCWQKQKVIWQEIQCFTNKCNYNRECGLAICWAKTHIQINLELKNKYHFRNFEIVKYVSTPSFCRPHPTPFLLQTFRPQPTPLPPSDPPPPPAPVTTLCIKVLTLSSPRVPYGIGCHYMLNIYLIFF